MAGSALTSPPSVDGVPSGYSDSKDVVNLVFTILNFLATTAIPLLIWFYGRRQEHARQQQEARQRLQAHVARLSDTDAMNVIGNFKQDCEAVQPEFNYGAVFRQGKEVKDTSSGIKITRQRIQQVDAARKKLQGIWDNIMDDYRAEQLGGHIYDGQHSRMLKRGLTYMKLVEPLEAANWVRLESARHGMANRGDYVLSKDGSCLMQLLERAAFSRVVVTVSDSPPTIVPSPVASSTTPTTGPTATGSHVDSASAGGADQPFAVFLEGARASRFRWLENQETMRIIGRPFWEKNPRKYAVQFGTSRIDVATRIPSAEAYTALLCGDKRGKESNNTANQWLEDMKAHWQAVCDAHNAAKSASPGATSL